MNWIKFEKFDENADYCKYNDNGIQDDFLFRWVCTSLRFPMVKFFTGYGCKICRNIHNSTDAFCGQYNVKNKITHYIPLNKICALLECPEDLK